MKRWAGGVFLLVLALLIAPAHAEVVTDTDFDIGTYLQTTSSAGDLLVSVAGGSEYFFSGNFTSQEVDVGYVVEWKNITWDETINATAGNSIVLTIRAGNVTPADATWMPWSANLTSGDPVSGHGRYVQFDAYLATLDNLSTPILSEVRLAYDLIPPVMVLDDPTNNEVMTTENVTFECTIDSPNTLTNVTLWTDVGGAFAANETRSVSGNQAQESFTMVNVPDGNYLWNCQGADVTGQHVFHAINYTVVVAAQDAAPTITPNIVPATIGSGDHVAIGVNVTDDTGVDSVWATIDYPNASSDNVTLVNNGNMNLVWFDEGTYLVTFHANDTLGNLASIQDNFQVAPQVEFNVSVLDELGAGLDTTLRFVSNNVVVATASETEGNFTESILDDTYDLEIEVYGGDFIARLDGVDADQDSDQQVMIDFLVGYLGYAVIYAVEDPFGVSSGHVTIGYNEADFANESSIGFYTCGNWDIVDQECDSSFTAVGTFEQDTTANEFRVNVTGFSAFALEQEGFCGDGTCSGSETNATCAVDCECADGTTQICGASDTPPCSYGLQTCSGGQWGTCVGEVPPGTEICNQIDDNCDGLIDNVNSGTTVQNSQCQCFNGGTPLAEVCNDIDDDCNGVIDSFTKACGSNVGICREGTQLCVGGVFESCIGGVSALNEEVCGNAQDDNCNSEVDEGCPNCFNQMMDGDEEGVDCGGSCALSCPQFPFEILAVIGVIVIILVVVVLKFRGRTSWETLEKRYTYTPAK